jgi:hypothetical protein
MHALLSVYLNVVHPETARILYVLKLAVNEDRLVIFTFSNHPGARFKSKRRMFFYEKG